MSYSFTFAVRAQKTNKTNSVHFKAASLLCAHNAPCAFPTFHCSSMTLKIIEHRHWRSDSKTAEREDAACWTSLTHMRVFLVKILGTIIHKGPSHWEGSVAKSRQKQTKDRLCECDCNMGRRLKSVEKICGRQIWTLPSLCSLYVA